MITLNQRLEMLSRRPAALYSRFKTVTFDPDNEYHHADYKFDQFKSLKRIKQVILWVSGLGFIILKRAEVNETFQFLWSCHVSARHDQHFNKIENDYKFSIVEIGDTLNQFAFVMAAAYCVYIVIALLCPAEDKDELTLSNGAERQRKIISSSSAKHAFMKQRKTSLRKIKNYAVSSRLTTNIFSNYKRDWLRYGLKSLLSKTRRAVRALKSALELKLTYLRRRPARQRYPRAR